MANSIALAKSYLPILDAVYKAESKSAILDAANSAIRFLGGNKVELFKTAVDGYGDYSRNTGFPKGSVTSTWEELTLSKDRGVELGIDSMDNEETLGQAFGTLVGEFARTQMIPELDAYRFAVYAAKAIAGTQKASADITVGTTDVAGLIDAADEVMQDAEVPSDSILFISAKAYNGLKNKITRYLANEGTVNRNVEMYNDHRVIVVPQRRFNTAVTLYDGSTNFGFTPAAGGYKINFMLIHPTAVAQVIKHDPLKVFTPEVNQSADAWKFQSRLYHDAFVLDNKLNGIYCHYASTANS